MYEIKTVPFLEPGKVFFEPEKGKDVPKCLQAFYPEKSIIKIAGFGSPPESSILNHLIFYKIGNLIH
jgi:hypothetical protein